MPRPPPQLPPIRRRVRPRMPVGRTRTSGPQETGRVGVNVSEGAAVAVIGSGVAGLTAAYELQRGGLAVTLYEADHRLGGHAHTQQVTTPDGRTLALDTGFIVHNERTYPHLLRLFGELGVATQPSEMSMSVRCLGCGLEYAGARGPGGLFAQPGALLRGRYLRMLAEVPRFHRRARRLLASAGGGEPTLAEFLRANGFSGYFAAHFLDPAGRRRLVLPGRLGRRLSGPLPVHVPGPPRHALGHRLPHLAHGRRRLAHLRRSGSPPRSPRCADGAPVRAVLRHAGRRRDRHRRRAARAVRRRGHRHPPRPGAAPAGRPDRGRAPGCSAPSTTRATRPCCTPTRRCCRAPTAPAPPGTTCCRPATAARDRSRSATT